jgi:acetyl-CoA carboxylase carboxyl transferase subunit beta
MSWFTRKTPNLPPDATPGERTVKTEGLWQKCEACSQILWRKTLDENHRVCPKCGYHFRIDAVTRLKMLLDGEWEEFDANLRSTDPLGFTDNRPYKERLSETQKTLGLSDAILSARGQLKGRTVEICSLELKFIGGSHGRGDGRKDHARHRALAGNASSADYRVGVRRRAHAGGRGQPHAVGQDQRRPDAARRRPACPSSPF